MSFHKILLIVFVFIILSLTIFAYFNFKNVNSLVQNSSSRLGASIFGLFGEESLPSSSTGTYIKNTNQAEDEKEVLEEPAIVEMETEEELVSDKEIEEKFVFTRDLWFGVLHADVMLLQRFLNREGFTLAESGAGSPGKETVYFGPRTFRALKKFQQFYQDSISVPLGMNKATGYLDYYTRKFVEINF